MIKQIRAFIYLFIYFNLSLYSRNSKKTPIISVFSDDWKFLEPNTHNNNTSSKNNKYDQLSLICGHKQGKVATL